MWQREATKGYSHMTKRALVGNWKRKRKKRKYYKKKALVICDGITFKMDKVARAAGRSVWKSSTASFASKLMEPFKESTMQMFIALLHNIAV